MERIDILMPEYVNEIPKTLKKGIIYICQEFGITAHLCACGCGGKTIAPLGKGEWSLNDSNGKITLRPSIGNWSGQKPYHAHYYITDNKIEWC